MRAILLEGKIRIELQPNGGAEITNEVRTTDINSRNRLVDQERPAVRLSPESVRLLARWLNSDQP